MFATAPSARTAKQLKTGRVYSRLNTRPQRSLRHPSVTAQWRGHPERQQRPEPFSTPLLAKLSQGAASVALSAALALGNVGGAQAATPILRFPASENPEIAAVQQTLVQSWHIVSEVYVDPRFNGHDWMEELVAGLTDTTKASSAADVYGRVSEMLNDLGDPYTRLSLPNDYQNFRVSSEGQLEGVGMLVAADTTQSEGNSRMMVIAPIKGGPAERAGVLPGDELISVNGKSVSGFSGEQVAQLLRGKAGSSVRVKLSRRSDSVPGVASRPQEPAKIVTKQVLIRREAVMLSSVYSELLADEASGAKVGYISLNNFSQSAAADTAKAIKQLEKEGASSYILDLRNNGGGLVQAGLDIARLWLDGPASIFHVHGRFNDLQQNVTLPDGIALTHHPLAVLVNKGSASASEILAGALHDNNRASIIGNTPTFGKGKIQSVFELDDGSALFVTVAKYTTPNDHEIDQIGITPDMTCGQPRVLQADTKSIEQELLSLSQETSEDPCVQSAERFLRSQAHKEA